MNTKIVTFSKTYPSSSSSKVSKAVTKFWFWFFNFLFWALYFSLVVLSCSIWSFKFCIVFLHSSTSSSWPVYGFKDFHWLRKQHRRYTALAIFFFISQQPFIFIAHSSSYNKEMMHSIMRNHYHPINILRHKISRILTSYENLKLMLTSVLHKLWCHMQS